MAQGIVAAVEFGKVRVYSLNREHVAAGAALELAELRSVLWQRIAREFERWNVRPLHACVFESAARHNGDADSDIDLLLVRLSTTTEVNAASKSKSAVAALGLWAEAIVTRTMSEVQIQKWETNVNQWQDLVRRWTGNPLQVVTLSAHGWSEQRRTKSTVRPNVRQDEIRLYDELGPTVYKYPKVKIS